MKPFGEDDNTKDQPQMLASAKGEDFDGLDELESDAGLSASGRGFDGGAIGGRGCRTSTLVIVLALVFAGAAGGYYYISSMSPDTPARPAAPLRDMQASQPSNAAVVTADMPLIPEEQPAAVGLEMPEQTDMSALTGMPENISTVTDPSAMPPVPDAPADMVVAADAAVVTTSPDTPVAAEAPVAETPAAPAEMPHDVTGFDMPKDQGMVTPPEAVSAAAAVPQAAVAAETPAAAPVVAADLPVPEMAETVTLPPATAEEVAARNAAAAPSRAELAIVENAAILDAMTAPAPGTASDPAAAGRTVNEILAVKPAIVRPLPEKYLVVRKDYDDSDIETRLKVARTALAQNRNAASLQLFDELLRDYPMDRRALMGRALTLQKLGQTDQAVVAYEQVLSQDPANLDALTNMLGLLKLQNPQLAIEKLSELRAVYPFNADVTAQLGIAHAGARSYEEALKYLDMADALRPGSTLVTYNRAVLYDRMGRTDKAAPLYRQLVQQAADGTLESPVPVDSIQRRLGAMR